MLLPLGQGVDWRNKKQPLEKGGISKQRLLSEDDSQGGLSTSEHGRSVTDGWELPFYATLASPTAVELGLTFFRPQ